MIPQGKYYIDRIEEDKAVLVYSRGEFTLPSSILPEGSGEGDFLDIRLSLDRDLGGLTAAEVQALRQRMAPRESDEAEDDRD